jgi:ketosteroid isomerase-like protein
MKKIIPTLSIATAVFLVAGATVVNSAYGQAEAPNDPPAGAAADPHAGHGTHSEPAVKGARQRTGGTPVPARDLSATLASAQANATATAGTPARLLQLLGERIVAKDLNGIIALHEPTAAVVNWDGTISKGRPAIRAMYIEWFKSDPVLIVNPLQTLVNGGQPGPNGTLVNRTASIMGSYTLEQTAPDGTREKFTGNFCDIVRQQPDGTWLYLQDNPYPPHS